MAPRPAWPCGPSGGGAPIRQDVAGDALQESELVRALFAPWVLHAGLGPENAFAGEIGRVIASALEAAGAPIVKGGAGRAVAAFEALICEQRGEVRTGADVAEVIVADGRASGVKLATGETLTASRGVICSVTPTQLARAAAAGGERRREPGARQGLPLRQG